VSRTVGDLLLRIGADQAAFQTLRDQLQGGRESVADFVKATEALSLNFDRAFTAPLEHAAEALVEFANQFQEASNILIRNTGAMGDELAKLDESVRTVLGHVDETSTEVATTVALLASRFSLTGEELDHLSEKMLDFAQATGGDVNGTVSETVKIFSQWSVATADQVDKLNELMRVAQASATPVIEIEQSLAQFGPALREAGIGFDQAALMIGNLAKSGVDLAPTLGGIQKALGALGKAGLQDPLEGLQLLADKIKNATSEGQAFGIGASAFGKGAASMVEAIRSGKLSFDDFAGSLKLSDNEISKVADTVKTLGETWNEVWNKISLAFKPFADALASAIRDLLKAAEPLIAWVKGIGESFAQLDPVTKNIIIGFAALIASIGPLAGIIAAAGFAFETFMGVMAPFAAIVSGPLLVPGLIAIGVAIAAWAIYEAVTKISKLRTELESLYDLQSRGVVATADQADQIKLLTGVIDKYNSSLDRAKSGAKQIEVSPFTPGGQALTPTEYLKALQQAVDGIGGVSAGLKGMKAAIADVDTSFAASGSKINLSIDTIGATQTRAGDAARKWSAATSGAVDQVLEKFSAMKQVEEQIKKLQEVVGAESLPIKKLQLEDLQRRAFAPTQQDADNQWLAYFDEVIKLNRAAAIQSSDDTLEAAANLRTKLKEAGMDTQQAFSLLGVTSQADIDRQVEEVNVAYARIYQSQSATDGDRTRALIANREKVIALWRQTGQQIADDDILTLEKMKAEWAAATQDIGRALSTLGISSVDQVENNLSVVSAALDKIRESVEAGKATQLDADNAEIASLQKKAQQFAAIGKAMSDEETARLAQLLAQRQQATFTTQSAFQFFGIPSQQDFDNTIGTIEAAYRKIAESGVASEQQLNAARAGELQKMIDEYRKAGRTVTDDMLTEWKDRTAAAQRAALDIDQAFKILGTVSTTDATNQIKLLDAAFDKLANDASVSAGQLQAALVSKLQGTIDELRKAGTAASDELVHQLDQAKVKLQQVTMNIDDAYKQLGVQSLQSIRDSAELAKTALDKINADTKASLYDRLQAQIAYNEDQFKLQVASGQQVDEFLRAQNTIAKQRIQEALSDQQNIYLAFAQVIKNVYGAIQNDIADVILGAKTMGQAFQDIAQQIEKALVQFVINKLLLTQKTLDQLTDTLLGFLKDLVGDWSTSGGLPNIPGGPGPGGGGGGGTGGGTGGGGIGGATGGGLLGKLSDLTNVLSLIVNVISSIVQGIQGARQITLLGRIEESTRRADIALEQGPESISEKIKAYLPMLQGLLDYMWNFQSTILTGMSSDLDGIASDVNASYWKLVDILAAIRAGGKSGGSASADNQPLPGALIPVIPPDVSSEFKSTMTAWSNAYSDMAQSANKLSEAIPVALGAVYSVAASTTQAATAVTEAVAAIETVSSVAGVMALAEALGPSAPGPSGTPSLGPLALAEPIVAPAVTAYIEQSQGGPLAVPSPYGLRAVPEIATPGGSVVIQTTVSQPVVLDNPTLRNLMSEMQRMFNDSLRQAGLMR